jgi:hypothetical protein
LHVVKRYIEIAPIDVAASQICETSAIFSTLSIYIAQRYFERLRESDVAAKHRLCTIETRPLSKILKYSRDSGTSFYSAGLS